MKNDFLKIGDIMSLNKCPICLNYANNLSMFLMPKIGWCCETCARAITKNNTLPNGKVNLTELNKKQVI